MMRQTTFSLGLLAIVSLLFVACKHGDEPGQRGPEGTGETSYNNEVSTNVSIFQQRLLKGPHRVNLGPDNTGDHSKYTEKYWGADDHIICWNEDYYADYRLTGGAGTGNGIFAGKALTEDDNVQGKNFAEGIKYAFFPFDAVVMDNKGGMTPPDRQLSSVYYTRTGEQTYQAPIDGNPTFGTKEDFMTGKYDPTYKSIIFQSTCGALLIRIKGSSFISKMHSLKLTDTGGAKLWGTFAAVIGNDGVPTVTYVGSSNDIGVSTPDGTNELVLNCATNGTPLTLPTDAYTNFYFVLPYGTLTSGFTIEMDTDGEGGFNDGTITTTKNNEIKRADIKVMPALELTENITLTWNLDDLYQQGTVQEF